MEIVKKIIEMFSPDDPQSDRQEADRLKKKGLTNQMILEELKKHFERDLMDRSVGDRMLYPMSFNIILHQDDFNARHEDFPFIVPEVVKSFYAIIREQKETYADYTHPANYWNFHFVPCEMETVNFGNMEKEVSGGHVLIWATLFDELDRSHTEVSADINVSVCSDQSNVIDRININRDALPRLDMLSDRHFKIGFNPSLTYDVRDQRAMGTNPEQLRAIVSYHANNKKYSFTMTGDSMRISGRSDQRKDRDIFRLESDLVKETHAEIRYFPDAGRFRLVAFGPAIVDEEEVPVSSGGKLQWTDLSRKSQIILEDIFLEFESKV